jgi:predicted deacylase
MAGKSPKRAPRARSKPPGEQADPITVAGVTVAPGERRRIEVPVARSYGGGEDVLPLLLVNGRRPGPRLFVSAAIHGDEINGVEVIRRLLNVGALSRLHGALLAVPVVNVYGFTNQNRYLPDRRDLNRAFPGSARGSLASRLAHVFMEEIVAHATHGIDLHTGSNHRTNLPQVRACLDDPETRRLAEAFGAPVVLNANLRDGSLRQAVLERDIPMLLYEAGEALRFDEVAIRGGVRGVVSVMRAVGMLPAAKHRSAWRPVVAKKSLWVRAPASGILRTHAGLGDRVERGAVLGHVADPLGESETAVKAPAKGLVIARTNLPLVNEGDGLYHLALFGKTRAAAALVETFHAELDPGQEPSPSGEPPIV